MARILVIEDAHLLRNDIIETLSLEGYDVIGAENGVQGVQVAREYKPDVIVCDIMMPELDGYGVLEELRRDPDMAATPFIFMTAKTEKADVRLGMGLGADDYLTKPFITSDLLNSIRARLEQRARLDQHTERRLDQLRENILTALPHELRTPLNAIIGFSEMMMTEAHKLEPDQITEWGQHINSAALRLYQLIEKYLLFVRIETLARDPEKADVLYTSRTEGPGSLIAGHATQKAQSVGREADLVLQIQDAEGVRISEQDLARIVDELVDNAFKFSQPGTTVEVNAQPEGTEYVLSVKDSGRGMTLEQINAVGAYMQFDRWLYEQQGMGLGLAIVRRLTQLLGGSFAVESVPCQNTTVQVRLPLAAGRPFVGKRRDSV